MQVSICTVSDKSVEYATSVLKELRDVGVRAEFDSSGERIGAKIRRSTLEKIPYILVIGEQEAATRTVNVRTRDGGQLGSCPLSEFLAVCADEISTRSLTGWRRAGQALPS